MPKIYTPGLDPGAVVRRAFFPAYEAAGGSVESRVARPAGG